MMKKELFSRKYVTIEKFTLLSEYLNMAKTTSYFHNYNATIAHLERAQENFRFFFFSQTSYWNAYHFIYDMLEILFDLFFIPEFKVRAKIDQILNYFLPILSTSCPKQFLEASSKLFLISDKHYYQTPLLKWVWFSVQNFQIDFHFNSDFIFMENFHRKF